MLSSASLESMRPSVLDVLSDMIRKHGTQWPSIRVLENAMKRLLLLGLVVLLCGCPGANEPSYQDQPMSTWLSKLKDKNPATRQEAAKALGVIGQPAVPALAELMKEPDNDIRIAAADALGHSGSDARGALPALEKAMKDPEPQVRQHVAYALAVAVNPGDQSLLPTLINGLQDQDPEVRRQVAMALGRFGPTGKSALSGLNAAFMKEEDGQARRNMKEAIDRIQSDVRTGD
jgi:HEAT repeat protein